jgi:hypothetical protein
VSDFPTTREHTLTSHFPTLRPLDAFGSEGDIVVAQRPQSLFCMILLRHEAQSRQPWASVLNFDKPGAPWLHTQSGFS